MKVTRFIIFVYGVLISALILIFSYLVLDVTKTYKQRQNQEILNAVVDSTSTALEGYFQNNLQDPKEKTKVINSFWKTLTHTRIGKTGETYLVD